MISVIVTSRVEGNVNHNINELIRSLAEHSRRPDLIELLVKFDQDDKDAYEVQAEILNKKTPFLIRTVLGPRGRGYIDIHRGYNQLVPIISKDSRIVIAMADDFRAERDWDTALNNAAQGAGEYFIIHGRPHPVPKLDFLKQQEGNRPNFSMIYDMFDGEDLYIIDEAPAWSIALLNACHHLQFKYVSPEERDMTFPVSFTDAWTLCLEWCLWHNHQINITQFMPSVFVSRKTCEVDQPGNPRWHTDRKKNFDYIKSEEFKDVVSLQAEMIAYHMHAGVK